MKWSVLPLLVLIACGSDVPKQPLPFSHAIHAGQETIACVDCHAGAERGAKAGLPSIGDCMRCHMRPQGDPTRARDQVVRDRADKGGAFRFVQVTRNPGHVYFSHRAHVSFAKMTCESCHGDVTTWAQSPRAPEASLVDMDACMACHRKKSASNECQICHR